MDEHSRISVRNVKYAAFASEETMCFSATVLFDGKPACVASNDGKGGATSYDTIKGQSRESFAYALAELIVEAKRLEPAYADGALEVVVNDLLNVHLTERDLARALKKKLIFLRSDKPGIWEQKVEPTYLSEAMDRMRVRQPTITYTFLNELPLPQAARTYIDAARGRA